MFKDLRDSMDEKTARRVSEALARFLNDNWFAEPNSGPVVVRLDTDFTGAEIIQTATALVDVYVPGAMLPSRSVFKFPVPTS